jgi:hypothetical protein
MSFTEKKNNATSKIATVGGIASASGSAVFAVTTGEGALFPTATHKVSIDSEVLGGCTRSGDIITCTVRGDETSTAASHAQGATVELTITAGALQEFEAIFEETSQTSLADKLLLKEITPATDPSSGYREIYFKADGHLYMRDSAGSETQLDTASPSTAWVEASDGATITFNLSSGNKQRVVLGGNRALALSNVTAGKVFLLRLTQDGTGTRTVTWFNTIKWAGGTPPTLTTTINKADVLGFIQTDTDAYDGFVVGQNL